MAETLNIVWLDGSKGGVPSGRSSGAMPTGPQASQATSTTGASSGPKKDDNSRSLIDDIFTAVGWYSLAQKVYSVIERFEALNRVVETLTGKASDGAKKEEAATAGPKAAAKETSAAQSTSGPKSAGEAASSGAKANPLDDWIEGEFTPKTSDATGMAQKASKVAPAAMEGEVVGPAVTAAIEGEMLPAVEAAGAGLAGVAAVAIPLTIALAAVIAGVAAFALGLKQAYADIEALEGYSPELSNANAMAEVRSMMAEINRADRLGPQLADLSDITSRGQEALYDIVTELMSAFLDYAEELKPFVEAGIVAAQLIPPAISNVKEALDVLVAAAQLDYVGVFKEGFDYVQKVADNTKKVAKILEEAGREDKEQVNDPFIADFFRGVMNLNNPNPLPPAGIAAVRDVAAAGGFL